MFLRSLTCDDHNEAGGQSLFGGEGDERFRLEKVAPRPPHPPSHRRLPAPIDLVRIKRPLHPKESIFVPSVFIDGACKIVGQNGTLASLFILFSTDTLTARYYL